MIVFVIFALMIFAVFMERPGRKPPVDDGLFHPIHPKGLPSSSFPSGADIIDLNNHNL